MSDMSIENSEFSNANESYTTYQVQPEDEINQKKTNGFQIASMVLGIIGILICCCYGVPSVIFGIIGLILAIVGNKKGKTGIGIAGLVLSIISIVFGIASAIYYGVIIYAIFVGGIDTNPDVYEIYKEFIQQYQA